MLKSSSLYLIEKPLYLYAYSCYLAFYVFIPSAFTHAFNIILLAAGFLPFILRPKASKIELLIPILLAAYATSREVLISNDSLQSISIIARYFAFVPLAFFFSIYRPSKSGTKTLYDAILLFFCLSSLISLLSVFLTEWLYNIANDEVLEGVDRGYGFLLNPSYSAIVLLATYWLCIGTLTQSSRHIINKKIISIIIVLDLLALGSGSGYVFYIVSVLMYLSRGLRADIKRLLHQSSMRKKFVAYALITSTTVFVAIFASIHGIHKKIDLKYIVYLINYKYAQLENPSLITQEFNSVSFSSPFNKFLGISDLSAGFGSDFGWGIAYLYLGVFGLILLFLLLILLLARNDSPDYSLYICIAILVLSAFHYPAIFTLPGTSILAVALSTKSKCIQAA